VTKKKKSVDWSKFKIGAIVSGKVSKIESYGVIIDYGSGVTGFVHTKQAQVRQKLPALRHTTTHHTTSRHSLRPRPELIFAAEPSPFPSLDVI